LGTDFPKLKSKQTAVAWSLNLASWGGYALLERAVDSVELADSIVRRYGTQTLKWSTTSAHVFILEHGQGGIEAWNCRSLDSRCGNAVE
jgi:hypothetical protein